MTFLYVSDNDASPAHVAEICPVHWRTSNANAPFHDTEVDGLTAIATVIGLDGDVCHVPCQTMQTTRFAREISSRTATPMPELECMPLQVIDYGNTNDWKIGWPTDVDERDLDVTWMSTPMPPTGRGVVRDREGKARPVLLSPRLVMDVDVHHEPKRYWLCGSRALVGVLSVSYAASPDVRGIGPQPPAELEVRWPCDRSDGGEDIVKMEMDGDDPYLYGDDWSQICQNQELAIVRLCQEIGRGNEEWSLRLARMDREYGYDKVEPVAG